MDEILHYLKIIKHVTICPVIHAFFVLSGRALKYRPVSSALQTYLGEYCLIKEGHFPQNDTTSSASTEALSLEIALKRIFCRILNLFNQPEETLNVECPRDSTISFALHPISGPEKTTLTKFLQFG